VSVEGFLRYWRTGKHKETKLEPLPKMCIRTTLEDEEIERFIATNFNEEELRILERFVVIKDGKLFLSPALLFVSFSLYERLMDIFEPFWVRKWKGARRN